MADYEYTTRRSSIHRRKSQSFGDCRRKSIITTEYIRAPTPPPIVRTVYERAPTPPPIIKTVYERAPTPEPRVIERITVRKEPPMVVETIVQQPVATGWGYVAQPAVYYTTGVQYVPTMYGYQGYYRSRSQRY